MPNVSGARERAFTMSANTAGLEVRVRAVRREAEDVVSVDLVSAGDIPLVPFTAGAHIDVYLPNGLTRNYSLLGSQADGSQYRIGVFKEPHSRGGSLYIHEQLQAGARLKISEPRNHFALAEEAKRSVLFAGGIGVTPILSMLDRLNFLHREWLLYYCVRTRAKAGFRSDLEALAAGGAGRIVYTFDAEPGGTMLDIGAAVAQEDVHSHFYCCGPRGMLEAFKQACLHRPPRQVHFESFTAPAEPAAAVGGFSVVLARSGRRVAIPQGSTILDVLIEEGADVSYSCAQGICGACETAVLAGVPDHHDLVLTEEQRSSNKVMMICCSGCKGSELVLDL